MSLYPWLWRLLATQRSLLDWSLSLLPAVQSLFAVVQSLVVPLQWLQGVKKCCMSAARDRRGEKRDRWGREVGA